MDGMDEDSATIEPVTWWAYVQRTSKYANDTVIGKMVGITGPSVGRWRKGSLPEPAQAAAFARAYRRPVLEAFLAAGYLTPEEADEKPSAPPSLAKLDDADLIKEIERRFREGGTSWSGRPGSEDSDGNGAGSPQGSPPADELGKRRQRPTRRVRDEAAWEDDKT